MRNLIIETIFNSIIMIILIIYGGLGDNLAPFVAVWILLPISTYYLFKQYIWNESN